ncbi:MAG: hypothetical protein K0R50_387 [Eubacterium sp.]|jgi:phage baseplate assembly protein W|nr:hypothetical protein [Eubacterium sp.]
MSFKVSSKDMNRIKLNESDRIASVIQNIAIIISTRQGTVPLYRGFGLPMQFVDKPIPVAKALLMVEITEAIAEYEPRAELVGVTFEIDESVPGKLIPTVEVDINDE